MVWKACARLVYPRGQRCSPVQSRIGAELRNVERSSDHKVQQPAPLGSSIRESTRPDILASVHSCSTSITTLSAYRTSRSLISTGNVPTGDSDFCLRLRYLSYSGCHSSGRWSGQVRIYPSWRATPLLINMPNFDSLCQELTTCSPAISLSYSFPPPREPPLRNRNPNVVVSTETHAGQPMQSSPH